MSTGRNEQLKLTASAITAIGVAFFGFSTVQPYFAEKTIPMHEIAGHLSLLLVFYGLSLYILSHVE